MGGFYDPYVGMAYVTSVHFPLARTLSLGYHLATPNSKEAGKHRLSVNPERRETSLVIS